MTKKENKCDEIESNRRSNTMQPKDNNGVSPGKESILGILKRSWNLPDQNQSGSFFRSINKSVFKKLTVFATQAKKEIRKVVYCIKKLHANVK